MVIALNPEATAAVAELDGADEAVSADEAGTQDAGTTDQAVTDGEPTDADSTETTPAEPDSEADGDSAVEEDDSE